MYETLLTRVLMPIHERVLRRRRGDIYLKEYGSTQWLKKAELQELQLRKLNVLLEHCWRTVPFLRKHWRSAGLRPGPISSLANMDYFPVLTKKLVRENFDEMRSEAFKGEVLRKVTGGSTGEPFEFEYTQDVYARRVAVMWRGYAWAGAAVGRKTLYLWGAGAGQKGWKGQKERLFHKVFNREILNTFDLSESNIKSYVDRLNAYRPRIIVGYVSPLAIVARFIEESRSQVYMPEAVITGAESLGRADRLLIERAFKAPVYETYGCREFMLMGAECPEHAGLHLNADHLLLQTLGKNGISVVGEPGEVCITDFHNQAMPLVRYLNGDVAVMSDRVCRCGRELPLLERVEGRLLDTIRTPDGRIVPGEFFVHAMTEFPCVRQFLVVQHAIDRVEVRLAGVAPLSLGERERIRAAYSARLGERCHLDLVEVDDIPLTSSGKRRVTISNIARSFADLH